MTPQFFGRWVARMCEERKLTRARLAEKLGVDRNMLRLYARGETYDGRPVMIPRTLQLAMSAVELGFEGYEPKRIKALQPPG